jgi:hypothetical protein
MGETSWHEQRRGRDSSPQDEAAGFDPEAARGDRVGEWNPLESNIDARQLVEALSLETQSEDGRVTVTPTGSPDKAVVLTRPRWLKKTERLPWTRRAITLAAAGFVAGDNEAG